MDLSETIAKSYNRENSSKSYKQGHNLLDQSMWDHIRTGVEACLALLSHLESVGFHPPEEELKVALIAFVLHDLHKDSAVEKKASSEYALSLEELERVAGELCRAVGTELPPAALLRAAGVSNFSPKLGDLGSLSNQYSWTGIRDWVKLMDQTASIIGIAECMEHRTIHSLEEKLRRVLPPKLTENLRIVYHRVQEMRGMVTTQLHNGMALLMKRYGYFPWLRFGDGTLYITFAGGELPDKDSLMEELTRLFFRSIKEGDQVDWEKLFNRATLQCQTLAFLVNQTRGEFAWMFHELFMKPSSGSKTFPGKNFTASQLAAYGAGDLEELYRVFGVDPSFDEEFREK